MGLEVVCAWCGKREERPCPADQAAPASPHRVDNKTEKLPRVSHAICESCYVRELAQVQRFFRERRRSA